MATALEAEVPEQLETLAPSRVIHVLLAQTEQRLVATFERYVGDLVTLRASVDAILAMADSAAFLALGQTPEVPLPARDRMLASDPRRFANWRQAVTRMLLASGRPVPWPLEDPRANPRGGPRRAAWAASDDPGTPHQPLPGSGGQPAEQDEPQRPRSTTPLGRPTHEGLPRTPDSSDPHPDLPPPEDAGLRARLTRLVGWGRASESPRRT
jgi:hypothetical protein